MAMVSGRGGKPMFTMTDEDLRPIRRASKDDTTAVRAIVRDYRASGGARILVVGSDTNGHFVGGPQENFSVTHRLCSDVCDH